MELMKIKTKKEPEDFEELKNLLYRVISKHNTLIEKYEEVDMKRVEELTKLKRMRTLHQEWIKEFRERLNKLESRVERDSKDLWSFIHGESENKSESEEKIWLEISELKKKLDGLM